MEKVVLASPAYAPLGLTFFALAMTIGRILGDRGRVMFGDKKLMIICSIIATTGIAVVITFIHPIIAVAGFFLIGLGLSVIVPIAYSIAGNSTQVSPGVGLAMVTSVGYTGFIFGPPIIGFLADWQNLRMALLFVAALFLVMTWLSKRYRKT